MTDDFIIEEDAIHLEDAEESMDEGISNLIPYISERYKRAEDYRYQDEERWIKAYRNYRGLYGSDVQFTESERSRVFIKITKTKTLAAYGQIVDVLFANHKFPLSIDPTQLPDGVAGDVHFDPKESPEVRDILNSPYGFSGDGKDLGSALEFKSEIQMSLNLSDSTEFGMSYNHISNASLGDKNPGANSYMINFLKHF